MKTTSDCFFCVELFEMQEKTTLYNLDLFDALNLCMGYVARYSHMLEIPVSVILGAIEMEREELLRSGIDMERHIYMQKEGEPFPLDEEGEIEQE